MKSKLGTMSDEERREHLSRPVIVGVGLCTVNRPTEDEWARDTEGVKLPPREETDAMFGLMARRGRNARVERANRDLEHVEPLPPAPPTPSTERDPEPPSTGSGIVRN